MLLPRRNPFILRPPPRRVPPLLVMNLLFGGMPALFGWAFGGFGMIFVWVFAMQADLSLLTFHPDAKTDGRVTRMEQTRASEGGGEGRQGTPIYATHYEFNVNGRTYNGVSFATGRFGSVGQTIAIEYEADNPSASRIANMRTRIFPPWVLLVWLFPIIGFGMALARVKKGLHAWRLLATGNATAGALVQKVATNTSYEVNGRHYPVYRMVFEFDARDGQRHRMVTKTHLAELLEDDREETLIYNPDHPVDAITFDNLPGEPRIEADGSLGEATLARTFFMLLLPLACILGHGYWFLFHVLQ